MKAAQIYFISGVCGVGKTSVITHLKNILPAGEYDVRDFDERGVPDGGGLEWHNKETLYWLDIANANAKENKSTIICGFAEPERLGRVHDKEKHLPAQLILLHASGDTIRKRLIGRYPTPESIAEINRAAAVPLDTFIENNVSYAPELKNIFEKAGASIIGTDSKTPAEVAKKISELIFI